MSTFPFDGVVFDVDGVLFDTERLGRKNWAQVGQEMGWPQAADHYLEVVGQNRADIRQRMYERMGPDFPLDAFLLACSQRGQERMEREGVPLKPGVVDILSFLRDRDIPLALATSTSADRTRRRLELTGLGPFFQQIITGDLVAHSKPDPEIYQMACRALGTAPARTLAVEDSRNGILSAHAAGMPVIMVPDLIPPTPELERLLFRRCASLHEVQTLLASLLPSCC